MRELGAIFRRELTQYFKSPIGWVLMAIFAFVSGIYFSINILSGYSNVASVLQFMQSLFFVLIPILTMKTFSEERRNGTEVLLYTSPASIWDIVLGKYLASLVFFLIMSVVTLLYVIITVVLDGNVDLVLLGTFIGFIGTAIVYIAIGVFCSSITENQIIAAILAVLIFVGFQLLNVISSLAASFTTNLLSRIDVGNWWNPTQEEAAGQAVANALNWLNPSTRLADYSRGIFDVLPLIFLLSYTFIFLFLTSRVLEKRRWSQR